MTRTTAPLYRLLGPLLLALLGPSCAALAQSTGPSDDLPEVSAEGLHAILRSPGLQRQGAPDADVIIIEYFDYSCPYCRRITPTFAQLIANDHKLAIVYKDWPVLGDVSRYAARCALAAGYEGKYLAAHDAMLRGPRLSSTAVVDAVLASAGIDTGLVARDLAAHAAEIDQLLARNDGEAHALLLDGTPGIIVGSQLLPGGAELGFFQDLIRHQRSGGERVGQHTP